MPSFTETLQAALAPTYTLERELTGGGMSRVFVATDVALGRRVVVKVLPPELAAGVNRERFRREIQLAALLQHPHIVPLLAAGEHGDLLYFTMPFIEGESLREAIATKGKHSVREVTRILRDVCGALAYAHDRGVIHRDIKPGNVLLASYPRGSSGGYALVADFGVAKALSAALPHSGSTTGGVAIGTPSYMAPEQLAGDPNADHRVDIYAVGLLAYELLAGVSPFTGPSPQATMAAQLTRVPDPLDQLRGDVPAALSSLVAACLAKLPNDRPATAQSLLDSLDALTETQGAVTPPSTPPRIAPTTNRTPMLIAAAVVMVAALSGIFLVSRSGADAPPPTSRGGSGVGMAAAVPAPAPTPAPTLTRDDSLAIAAAVRAQVGNEEASRAKRAMKDSAAARDAMQRALIDSLVRIYLAQKVDSMKGAARSGAVAAKPTTPPAAVTSVKVPLRRVVITEPRSVRRRPDLDSIARTVVDSLRQALATRGRYALVEPDSVREVLLRTRAVSEVVAALQPDLLISVNLLPSTTKGDSMLIMIDLRDISAASAYARRVVNSKPVPQDEVLARLNLMLASAMSYLAEMELAPRREQGPGAMVIPMPPMNPRARPRPVP